MLAGKEIYKNAEFHVKVRHLITLFVLVCAGFDSPGAQERDPEKRLEDREAARMRAELREQQRVTDFKKVIEARKSIVKAMFETSGTLARAAVAACDRAGYDAALSQREKHKWRENGWSQERMDFHLEQQEKYEQRLAATERTIQLLYKELSDARDVFTRDKLSGEVETQIRIKTDLKYRVAAHDEMSDAASSYNAFVWDEFWRNWIRYPKDCVRETLSHSQSDVDKPPGEVEIQVAPGEDESALYDYCAIVPHMGFQTLCYDNWRKSCIAIPDESKQNRCRQTLQPGGPRNAQGEIWDFCQFMRGSKARSFCYEGFREMVPGFCGAVLEDADRVTCWRRAANLPPNRPVTEKSAEGEKSDARNNSHKGNTK